MLRAKPQSSLTHIRAQVIKKTNSDTAMRI
jgi:hypothetical protein